MASLFYKRYIPPQPETLDHREPSRPAKKRKKSKSASSISLQQEQTQEEIRDVVPSNDHKDQEPQSGPIDPETLHNDDAMRKRHKTVLDKYDKAAKEAAEVKAQKFVTAENDENERQEKAVDAELHGLEPLPQPAPVEQDRKVSAFSALPEWLQAPVLASSADIMAFTDLALHKNILTSLEKRGYSSAFAIQSTVLPMLLPGPKQHHGDICISAATGSGKTLAYVLPMVQSLRDKPVTRLRGLIVVPTRELVNQVKETLDLCSTSTGLKIATAVGNKSLKEEQTSLVEKRQRYDPEGYKAEQEKEIDEDEELMDWDFDKKFGPNDDLELFYNHVIEYTSKVDILICTPGRLVEHIQSTTGFTLEHVQWLVIDEADRLLDESFQQWVDVVMPGLEYIRPPDALHQRHPDIFRSFRRREMRKVILSATMTRDISKLMTLNLRRPKLVVLEGQTQGTAEDDGDTAREDDGARIEIPATLQEYGVPIPEHNTQYKPLYLIEVLESGSHPQTRKEPSSSPIPLKSPETSDSATSTESEDHSPTSNPPPHSPNLSPQPQPQPPTPSTHGTLIFTSSNEHAHRLSRLLALLRPSWKTGTLTKSTTTGSSARKTLSLFRQRKLSILIASDRASRGLDIPGLAHVINYDVPGSVTAYVHRVGRTARAGREGKATTLVLHSQGKWFWKDKGGVAGSEMLGRGLGGPSERRVVRRNLVVDLSEGVRREYEDALRTLGEEARG